MLQTGQTRPAISPSAVRIYLVAPAKYQVIGMVSGSDSSHWMSRDRLQQQILKELKSRAAKVGANGLLIKNTETGEVAGNSYGLIGSFSSEGQSITAFAIYVY